MAGAEKKRETGKRRNSYEYVDGNVVRKLQPEQSGGQAGKNQAQKSRKTSRETRKNRERALQMNLGYVLFLAAAGIATVFMCVNYLKLQAENTKLRHEVTSLEVSLDEAKLENDADYNRIMANVDMEHVKDVAMNKLGMDHAKKGQIVTYSGIDSDYVRQYTDVPEE